MENNTQSNIPPIQPVPQTLVSPSANLHKILLSITLSLIIITTSVFWGIQIGKNQTSSQQPVSIQPDSSPPQTTVQTTDMPTTNQTANWKTYTNSTYGYQIDFQSDWTQLAGSPEESNVLNFRKNDYEIGLTLIPTSNSTIQEHLKQSDKEAQTAWEGTPILKVISTKLTKINNYNVIQREEEWLAAAFSKPVINTYFLNKNHIYSITLKYIGNNPNSTIKELDTYQQILSTLKFIN